MTSNFRIFSHRNSDNLHLRLDGDFDGTAAYELLNTLKKHGADVDKVFIHTSGLKRIHAFGQNVLQNNLSIRNVKIGSLIFTGENGPKIAPEGSKFY